MGRASSSKKVSRAASTGGGRTARGAKPWLWYTAVVVVVALGVAGIVVSRQERREELAAGSDTTPPRVKPQDHWHAAYGFFLCDSFAAPITDERDPKGIHTHGDGVIHIHPFVRSAAGERATLGVFADAVRMKLSDSEIRLPGGESFREGSTKCEGKEGLVQVSVDGGEPITTGIRDIKFTDRQLLTIAFAPEGTELPKPPSEPGLDNLSDVDTQSTTVPLPPGFDGGAPPAEGSPPEGTIPDGGAPVPVPTPTPGAP